MYENDIFEKWLDQRSAEIIKEIDKRQLTSEEMNVLVLKAQSNHFIHLDADLRREMQSFRDEVGKQFEDTNKRVETGIQSLVIQFDKRFGQVDKQFERIDKRFKQIDKRFDRLYRFMQWQTGIGLTIALGILIKLFMG